MSFSVKVEHGLLHFDVRYEGGRGPTDVHILLGQGKGGAGLIGYDHIPSDRDPYKGFTLDLPEGNPTLPHDDKGHLKKDTFFTLVWSFADEPREEVTDIVSWPSQREKIDGLAEEIGKGIANRKCFIATAAFGSPLEYEVVRLQLWRERVLRPTMVGRVIIALYALLSPPLASAIERRRDGLLGSLVRRGLKAFLRTVDRGGFIR